MCSIGDDHIEDNSIEKFMPVKPKFESNVRNCNKCKERVPQVVLRNKDAYCKTCFLQGTVHKFRGLLGKHHILDKNDHILVVHAGGHQSTALLHFLRTGFDVSTKKRLTIEPVVLFIERNYDLPLMERREILRKISHEAQKCNFPLYFASFVECIVKGTAILQTDFENFILNGNDKEKLLQVLNRKVNLTIIDEITRIFEKNIMVDAAKQLNCKSVFTTELAVDIASNMLTNVSLGRGSHLPLDVGICDSRDSAVKIVRPLRLFEIKELALYNFFNNLEAVMFTPIKRNPYSSVQNLMKDFVNNLQINYPATITTIVRTGDKLTIDKKITENKKCTLCNAPIENKSENVSSAESTNFSHWLSTQTPDYNLSPEDRYKEVIVNFNQSNSSKFCFTCSRISACLIKQ